MKFLIITFLFLVGHDLMAQTSYVAPTRTLGERAYQIGLSGEMFTSAKSVDDKGESVDFQDGESFSRLQGEFGGFYGLTDNLQIGGGVRFRQNSSTLIDTNGEELNESSTGVQSTFFSLTYAFKPVDQLQYALEGTYRYTPYTNEEVTAQDEGSLILGDDGNEYSAGLALTYASKTNNYLSGRVGYRVPGQNLSSEIYWQFEGALAWKHIALIAGVDGVNSTTSDEYSGDLEGRPAYHTGRTALYNSYNREWIAPYAGVNVAWGEHWRVEFKGSQVISGRSTDLGTAFGVALIRRVDNKKVNKVDTRFKNYDMEASITKVSPKKGYVVIDKGLADDVQKGMKIDFFEFDYVGGNILLARGTVIQSKADTAIVKITHRYNTKKELKEGVVARGNFR